MRLVPAQRQPDERHVGALGGGELDVAVVQLALVVPLRGQLHDPHLLAGCRHARQLGEGHRTGDRRVCLARGRPAAPVASSCPSSTAGSPAHWVTKGRRCSRMPGSAGRRRRRASRPRRWSARAARSRCATRCRCGGTARRRAGRDRPTGSACCHPKVGSTCTGIGAAGRVRASTHVEKVCVARDAGQELDADRARDRAARRAGQGTGVVVHHVVLPACVGRAAIGAAGHDLRTRRRRHAR